MATGSSGGLCMNLCPRVCLYKMGTLEQRRRPCPHTLPSVWVRGEAPEKAVTAGRASPDLALVLLCGVDRVWLSLLPRMPGFNMH